MTDPIHIEALKVHGSNNRFILIDEDVLVQPLDDQLRAALSLTLHSKLPRQKRNTDGVLFYQTIHAKKAICGMRMFNPDGTEAEMCGNGLRCAGRYGMQKLNVHEVAIKTRKSTLKVSKKGRIFADINGYSSEIGPIHMNIESMVYTNKQPQLPFIHRAIYTLDRILDDQVRFTALQVPNPHCIGLSYTVYSQTKVAEAFKEINHLNYFPQGVNLSIVCKMPKQTNAIFVVTCERGVGPTNACGTAMAASSLVAAMMGFVDGSQPIQVFNLGGFVESRLPQSDDYQNPLGNIILSGNATFMQKLAIEFDPQTQRVNSQVLEKFTQEKQQYAKMAEHAANAISGNFPDF